ncbi:MAG: hypothetical protein OEQ53_12350, partial [Saprospiraceae bacterium]|nr:hypothetical protein [Saprospiraceae bacterium]
SGIISMYFTFGGYPATLPDYWRFPIIVLITTTIWIFVTYLTRPTPMNRLKDFYQRIQPGGPGWRSVIAKAQASGEQIVEPHAEWTVPTGILAMLLGCLLVYSTLFATGKWLFGETGVAAALTVLAVVAAVLLIRLWRKLGTRIV